MTTTAQAIIGEAYRDLCGLRPGGVMSMDVLNDCFTELNELVDAWKLERVQILKSDGTQLAAFSALGTSYSLAPGVPRALRKNLAVAIAPMMKIHFKIPEPMLAEIAADAATSKLAITGVGV